MEMSDEVGSDEINELFQLTYHLEHTITHFSITGPNIAGDLERGFVYNAPADPNLEEQGL